jgi:O-antigen/teichoic acid export membrane protein
MAAVSLLRGRRVDAETAWHLLGATATKVAPVGVQLLLLVIVARDGSLEDVGRLALASAASFLCGALGELGFGTTLSVPLPYFGVADPPLRATRRLRLGAAVLGSVAYLSLWTLGLGQHDPRFLLVAPLPVFIALAAAYAGVMNAAGRLRTEGIIALWESVAILILVALLATAMPTLSAALLALTIGRGLGVAYRAWIVRGFPQSRETVRDVLRIQAPFAIGTGVIVVQGQADLLIIGFMGSLAEIGVYGPLLRVTYGTLLVAEALNFGMYGRAGTQLAGTRSEHEMARLWRAAALWAGVPLAVVFAVGVDPLLHLLLDEPVSGLTAAIALFAALIVVRCVGFAISLQIVRSGRQRRQVPVLGLAAVILVVGALAAGLANSITGLAAARLASEVVLLVGYWRIAAPSTSSTRRTWGSQRNSS